MEIRASEDAAHIENLEAENAKLRAALVQIAAFTDKGANERLASTGSYSAFDEPGSVKLARDTLKNVGFVP